MKEYLSLFPVAFGAVALILNSIAYCTVRKLTYRGQRRSRLCCSAWTSVFAALLLLGIGGFEIWWTIAEDAGAAWIGFVIALSGLYWMAQAMKYHKLAKAATNTGYRPFNHNDADRHREEPRRRSNAPLIVEVDPNDNAAMSIEPNVSSSISPSSVVKSRFNQPLICNAVPPSPFICAQGTESQYVAIPMSITKSTQIPRSGSSTPQGTGHTLGRDEEATDTLTEPQAEPSGYSEDEDGKHEVDEEDTPRGGPERKTSEGNDTMC